MTRLFLAAAATAVAAGCGLVDPNITQFDLSLPSKQFTIDTSRWDLSTAPQLVSMSCSTQQDVCAAGGQQACPDGECIAQCDAGTMTCDLTLFVSLYQMIDLQTEKPELSTIEDQPLLDVTIDAINFEVSANSMNIDTPEMVVYAAPATVMSPDARARRIGTVPPVPAGQTRSLTPIDFDAMGRDNLAAFMSDYKTPFNIIVGSELLVEMGSAIPMGAMTVRVVVEAHAGL
ncbi:MAG: hypothetical protein F9K40_23285 [Kofleriaceae bacterium]|nr:MAG: hypothetical protein F9K40_23285 [Kofleriaceae bacterium]